MRFLGYFMKQWFKNHLLEIVTITIVILVGSAMHFVTTYIPNETVVKILGEILQINESS